MVYPWHLEIKQKIADLKDKGNLPHAIMLSGGQGLGVSDLAAALAEFVLCQQPNGVEACGICKSCTLYHAGSHNDFVRLSPEEPGKQIKVEAVRSLVEFVTESSMRGSFKVGVIDPVEGLNINGANALLKTLEEPQGDTVLFLASERQEAVLPTIRSRCQIFVIKQPSESESLAWLEERLPNADVNKLRAHLSIAHGLPLLALRYVETDAWEKQLKMLEGLSKALKRQMSVSELAGAWADDSLADRLEWLLLWVEQMIRYAETREQDCFSHAEGGAMLSYLAEKVSLESLFEVREKHLTQLRLFKGTTNPNPNLLMESVILDWCDLM